jgi:EmrB/QacA subfamily drug resistance transporter
VNTRQLTLAVVCVATAMLMLDIAVVNTALEPISTDLHASLSGLKWIVDAYTLVLAATVLSAGSLADRFGRKRLFQAGLALFTVSSLGCALAGSIEMLDGARAVQGLGAAIMFAVSLAILADAFPGEGERRKALAMYGATIGASFAVGPLVGGALASGLGWRWIFLINLPLGIACMAITLRAVRESRDPAPSRLDVRGQVLLALGLFGLTYGMLQGNELGWADLRITGALGVAAVCLVAFVVNEHRASEPMLPLGFFRRRDFTAAQIVAFGISASMFAGYLYLTIYLQSVLGLSPIQTGLVYLPVTILSFVVAGATASMAERVAPAGLIVAGLGLSVIGLALMTMTGADSSWVAIEPGLILAMIGVGLINPVLSGLALGSLPDAQSGLAAGANDTFRQAGIAIGVAALGALVPVHVTDPAAFVTGLHHALLAGAALAAVSAVAVAVLLGQRSSEVAEVAVEVA